MKISEEKKEKISEQILAVLYTSSPRPIFTSHIAKEIARDEEFTKKLLKELKERGIILEVIKNSQGVPYLRRSRWKLSDAAYISYQNHQ